MGSSFVGSIHESPAVSGLMMVMNDTGLSYHCMDDQRSSVVGAQPLKNDMHIVGKST